MSSSNSIISSPSAASVVILGNMSTKVLLKFQGEETELAMDLNVTVDSNYPDRRRYEATFTLLHAGTCHQMGLVDGYHIMKPSATSPNRNLCSWKNLWLVGEINEEIDDAEREIIYALRALYKRTGTPRPVGKLAAGLHNEDEMIFIQKIHIKHRDQETGLEFAGNGLLKHVLGMYYQSFMAPSNALPEPLRMTGSTTFFLEPGYITDEEQSAIWDHLKPKSEHPTEKEDDDFLANVINKLVAIYTSPSIGYTKRACNVKVQKTFHTVLARRFERLVPPSLPTPSTSPDDKQRKRRHVHDDPRFDGEDDEPRVFKKRMMRQRQEKRDNDHG